MKLLYVLVEVCYEAIHVLKCMELYDKKIRFPVD